ncbi:MAG: hypothetical protein HYR64_05135 [Fimbriimonas ginsengisoli]|uniref:HEAT repeat domain-containing protein n=1 Tax=Fimbriimonas ginsengisoli TaxID=1005039 RepID=A0A931LVI9_FIMGI|nr:hypothetical protein [Fimbriimonas ginsengisoli]
MRILACVALASLCVTHADAQLTAQERKGIEDALYVGNLTPKDLEWQRIQFADPYRLPLIELGVARPLEAADELLGLHASAKGRSLSGLLQIANREVFGDMVHMKSPPNPTSALSSGLPGELNASVALLVHAIAWANGEVREALKGLSEAERRVLIESLPQWAVEEPKVRFGFVSKPQAERATILALLGRADLARIRRAAAGLAEAVERELPSIKGAAKSSSFRGIWRSKWNGVTVEIGGVRGDLHTSTDSMLCIDLGGTNRYAGRFGAGVGYCSVLIDLGDSTFDVPDLSVGVGVLGVGLAYLEGPKCTLRGRSLCFGAGLAGVGALHRATGPSDFDALALCQGFGQFGIGLLSCDGGPTRFSAGLFGQGAARTQGLGWLVDNGDGSAYRCGGPFPDQPLFADVPRSYGQGFASGYREDTGGLSGGVGLLTAFGGRNTFWGGTYCQGASYWGSLGSCYVAGANNTFTAYHYAQASAMHMTGAYLFALGGDDAFVVKYGAAHGIGHDYGVGFLLERGAGSIWAGRDSRPGIGNANGLGICVAKGPDNRAFGPPGVGNAARGSGSLGLFVDLLGGARYAEGLADGEAAVRPDWGIALASEQRLDPPASPARLKPAVGSLSMPGDEAMLGLYERATRWGVGTEARNVAEAVAQLIGIGKPALAWMLDHELRAADRLSLRAFVAVASALSDEGGRLVADRIASKDVDEARNALRIAADARLAACGAAVAEALKRPELEQIAARAAGPTRSRQAVDSLLALSGSSNEATALAALSSLSEIGDSHAATTAQALLGATSMPVRRAALVLLAKFPDVALPVGQDLARRPEEPFARRGIDLLAAVGSPAALVTVGPMLGDSRPGVRIQALLALDGRCPIEFRQALVALRDDRHPLVRAVARRIDPGR